MPAEIAISSRSQAESHAMMETHVRKMIPAKTGAARPGRLSHALVINVMRDIVVVGIAIKTHCRQGMVAMTEMLVL